MKTSKNNEEKAKYWEGHIEACALSGSTVAGYCREHGLTKQKYFYWKARLNLHSVDKKPSRQAAVAKNGLGFSQVLAESVVHPASRPIKVRVTEFELSNANDLRSFLQGLN